jgi:hypothetical protein
VLGNIRRRDVSGVDPIRRRSLDAMVGDGL